MSAVVAAMMTAVVGVLGTLFAPLITDRVTARREREERRRAEQAELRAAYTAMNRASRQFHTLLKDALHRLCDGVWTDQDRTALEQGRLDHRDRYAEAQLLVPERVLEAFRDVNRVLAEVDAAVRRLDRAAPRPGDTPEALIRTLKTAEPPLTRLRQVMREDLGIRR